MTNLSGIDYSLTSPAMTTFFPESNSYIVHCFSKKQSFVRKCNNIEINCYLLPLFINTYEKIIFFSDLFISLIKQYNSTVAIEDYSFGSVGKVFHIAENGGFLKVNIWKFTKQEPLLISPKTIKKFASGSGNASKFLMIECFEKETQIDLYQLLQLNREKNSLTSPITDICDSYFICKYLQQKENLECQIKQL